jgi:metallo-beta-lactamase family protein
VAQLTFFGAAGVVTGSKHLLETDSGTRVLLDCGMFQGLRELVERNWTPPPVDPRHLDAVVLSHGHLDHCGYLPALMQQGYNKPIYCTAATAEVANLVLSDSAHLQEDEARRAKKHPDRNLHKTPLYTQDDAARVAALFRPVEYNEVLADIAGCRFRLVNAGHIIGSAIVEFWFDSRKLTFTGDVGRYNRPLLHDPSPIAESDFVLCESTYGDRLHPASDPQDDLGAVINRAMERRGVLVVPSFAVGRTQELLYAIGQLQRASSIPNCKVYVDSPMGSEADAIMERHPEGMRFDPKQRFGPADTSLGAENVVVTSSAADSMKINGIQSGAIVISSSGMASGGRVLHHLRNRLPNANDTVCFVGFQSPGTLGRSLLDGAASVRIFGVPVNVAAQVSHIDGFSAHADRDELLRWFRGFRNKPQVYIVHAEPPAASALAQSIATTFGFPAQAAVQGAKVQM